MKCIVALLGLAALSGVAQAAQDHPVVKVMDLLESLRETAVKEGEEEEVTYAKFTSWCKKSLKGLSKAIEEGKDNIESLADKISGLEKEEDLLTKQIKKLGEELLEQAKSGTEAKEAREDAAALYAEADADFTSTLAAFEDAITALSESKTSTATMLAQKKVAALAQMALVLSSVSEDKLALMANPELPAGMDMNQHTEKYVFKAGNVLDLMKQLKEKFSDDQVEATKAETASINAYDLAKGARDEAISAAEGAKSNKEDRLGTVETDLATAKSDKENAEEDLKADEGTRDATDKTCRMRGSEWEERSKLRAGEIKAIDAAVGILEKVTGVRHETPENPTLPSAPEGSFVQLPAFIALSSGAVDPKQKAVNLLRMEAQKLHSKSFLRFAEQVAARVTGPFDDLDNMIQKMIFRLMAEQKDEDDHKNWCDLEVEKTETSKTDKEDKLDDLDAKLDAAKANVKELGEKIIEADEMVADLTAFMKESTETRAAGKKENTEALKDSRAAQDAISQAIAVMESFYKDSGAVKKESWEFIQAPVELPEEPSTWDAGYTGVTDPEAQPGGIISILKETSASFAKMEADTMAQEETDQRNYQEDMKESDIEKARRSKESEMKAQEKKRVGDKITAMEKNHKHTTGELNAVKQYEIDLEPACKDGDSSYDDRKSARDDEIAALKEAQGILAKAFDNVDSLIAKKSFLAPVKNHA